MGWFQRLMVKVRCSSWEKVRKFPGCLVQTSWEIGKEDHRKAIHSLKVGVALTLVSMLYVMEPLWNGIGANAMWAVVTVVVVLEFTVGATLCKGLNRGIGTVLAGSLAFFVKYVASKSNTVGRAVFIASSVFLAGTGATYLRFFPYVKNYDYGVVIFILTFNLITVSSYRIHNVLRIAYQRFYTIAIGCCLCLIMSLLVSPIWAGEDLHKNTIKSLRSLATSVQACINEYFEGTDHDKIKESESSEDPIFSGYREVLDSKSSDEQLALFASWEPSRNWRCYRFPWQQYVQVGTAICRLGYTVVALHGCLESEIESPMTVRLLFKEQCEVVGNVIFEVLNQLAESVEKRQNCSFSALSDHLNTTMQDLDAALKAQPRLFLGNNRNLSIGDAPLKQNSTGDIPLSDQPVTSNNKIDTVVLEMKTRKLLSRSKHSQSNRKIAITSLKFSEALPFAAFIALLVETMARLERVIEEVEELGRLSHFRDPPTCKDDKCEVVLVSRVTDIERIRNNNENSRSNHMNHDNITE